MAMFIKCQCEGCANEGTIRLTLRKRGGRGAYLCERHAMSMERYSYESTATRGGEGELGRRGGGFSYGMELETSASTIQTRIELCGLGFTPTSDSTVDVEYKSPIWYGLNSPVKTFRSIQDMMDKGELGIDYSCGTHFHVGHISYGWKQCEMVSEYYHEIFDEIGRLTQGNNPAANAVWGRSCNRWAIPTHESDYADNHTNMFNLQHDNTIEFRLCKFRSVEQYTKLVHFCKSVMATILNNFIAHYDDDDFDISRYPSIRYYRKHKAIMTGRKIAKLYIKLAAEYGYSL